MNKLQSEREKFSKANSYIRKSREEKFAENAKKLYGRMKRAVGNRQWLRNLAREYVELGYYSGKGSIGNVEFSIVKRVYREVVEEDNIKNWNKFCREVAPHLIQ